MRAPEGLIRDGVESVPTILFGQAEKTARAGGVAGVPFLYRTTGKGVASVRCVREIRGVVDGSETKAVAEKRPVWLDFLRAIFVGVFVFVATVGVQMVIIVSANYNTTIKPLVDLNRWMFTQLGWSWVILHMLKPMVCNYFKLG